ncbi:hypothetical protein TNCV_1905791 [Trichonephila clavipes]|nr:hypothetical protein TNCV_1905791 [Trichonephila clavipes]
MPAMIRYLDPRATVAQTPHEWRSHWNQTRNDYQQEIAIFLLLNQTLDMSTLFAARQAKGKKQSTQLFQKRSTIPPLLKICDKPIPEVKSLKILGIIFYPNTTWKNHINYLRQKDSNI